MGSDAPKLLLVGCGKMGGALLERTAGVGSIFPAVHVIDPAPAALHLKAIAGVRWFSALGEADKDFKPDLVVLAVKPQHMADVLPAYGRFKDSVFLSIAAGKTLSLLEKLLGGTDYPVVRTMPNLPVSIGEGVTAATANTRVSPSQRAFCDMFLKAVGDVVWLEDEHLMDVITALSANGPAYVFALCESMAKAGEALGLMPAMAMQLARRTIIGSGALLARSNESAENLRLAVTSPGGTTEAALKYLLAENGLHELMLKTITAGAKRAKELAQ